MGLRTLKLGFGLGSEGGGLKSEPLDLREEGWVWTAESEGGLESGVLGLME